MSTQETVLVLDTKWKVPHQGQPNDADPKQMFVYNELYRCGRSLLVYPEARGELGCDGVFDSAGHVCGTRFVGLFDEGRYSKSVARTKLKDLLASVDR